jgi:hypothetical protein
MVGGSSLGRGWEFFSYHHDEATLGPTQLPIQWMSGALGLELKRLGREADHSLSSSAEVKSAWSYTTTPLIRLHGVVLS